MLVTSSSGVRAGSISIMLAASLWGTTGTVRAFAPDGATAVSVGAARIVVGGFLLFLIGRHGVAHLWASGSRTRLTLGLAAICVAVYQTAYFASVARTGVAIGTVVTIGSAPAFAGLLAWTRPSARWLLATAGAVTGCALLVGGGGGDPVGVALALLSGCSYAVYATTVAKLIRDSHDDRVVAGATFGLSALILLPVLALGSTGWLLGPSGLLVVLYLGAVTTAGGYLLYVRGLRTVPAPVATTLTLVEPGIAAVLGFAVLGEQLTLVGLAGLAILAAALFAMLHSASRVT